MDNCFKSRSHLLDQKSRYLKTLCCTTLYGSEWLSSFNLSKIKVTDNLSKIKVTALRSLDKNAETLNVAQHYRVVSYYVHFHMAGINTNWELTWTAFLMSMSQYKIKCQGCLKILYCTTLCGSELLYPFSKCWF